MAYSPTHNCTTWDRPLFGMCGKPASRPTKVEKAHRARGGRQDVRSVRGRAAQSTNAAAAVRRLRTRAGISAGTQGVRPQRGPLFAPGPGLDPVVTASCFAV